MKKSAWLLQAFSVGACVAVVGLSACGDSTATENEPGVDAGATDAKAEDGADVSAADASTGVGGSDAGDAPAEDVFQDSAGKDGNDDGGEEDAEAGPKPVAWFEGTFRYLPAKEADLVDFVGALDHPNQGGYGKASSTRAARFETMLGALFEAVELALVDGTLPDWCGVSALALDAGYVLHRFRDAATGRWFLYGADTTAYGQAYFFVNPDARRNVVVESPHDPYDWATGKMGARVFLGLGARAFLLNKEHRCSDPDATPCDGITSACDGTYRESDVAHHTANTFHLLHRHLSDQDPSARFVQLHGFQGSSTDMVEVGDGSSSKNDPASVALAFASALRNYVPDPAAVFACQDSDNQPPSKLCGGTNVQGRATNAPSAEECTTGTTQSSGRFLHIEHAKGLREDAPSGGWFWTQVRDALHDTWPDCKDATCEIGPSQPNPVGCTCGEPCEE
jgi:hypothetical protein